MKNPYLKNCLKELIKDKNYKAIYYVYLLEILNRLTAIFDKLLCFDAMQFIQRKLLLKTNLILIELMQTM